MVDEGEAVPKVTIEHTASGSAVPDWLFNHHIDLAQVKLDESGESARIMILYPNLNSKDECLRALNSSCDVPLPIDSSLHVTIDDLIEFLHADFKLPAVIDDDAILFEIIHRRCAEVAASAGFPRLHTHLNAPWGRGRTRMLDQLHRNLCERRLPDSWEDDPGLQEYERVLHYIERRTNMTHPRLRINRIINQINCSVTPDEIFSLRDIEGIVMLNHDPTLSHLRIELLLAIAGIVPIHQLCNPGSFRLGEHGAFLLDIPPCNSVDELPDWLPPHLVQLGKRRIDPKIHHLGLQRPQHCDEAVYSLLDCFLDDNGKPTSDILIIDPDANTRFEKWNRLLKSLGLRLQGSASKVGSGNGVHWLKRLSTLGQGTRAWSLDSLRALLSQSSLPMLPKWLRAGEHPTRPDRAPVADISTLELVARTYHIQGGPGSLRQWLYALAQPRFDTILADDEEIRKTREQTQWWIISLAKKMSPLLHAEDQKVLREGDYSIGCDSGLALPLPDEPKNGDEWLAEITRNIDWEYWMDSASEGIGAVAGMQHALILHSALRQKQRDCSLTYTLSGREWVAEFDELTNSIDVTHSLAGDSSLRIMTPSQALGCTATVVILTHLGVEDWPLSVPTLPWLDSEQAAKAGLLDPDSPVRSARHCFSHALSAGELTFILDPTCDEETQPATPFAEWRDIYRKSDSITIPDFLISNEAWRVLEFTCGELLTYVPDEFSVCTNRPTITIHSTTPRSLRQRDGFTRRNGGQVNRPLINPHSILVCREESLHRDRIRREPTGIAYPTDYRPWDSRRQHASTSKLKLYPGALPKDTVPPRLAPHWPVMGRQHNKNRSTPSIDPRPLDWDGTGISSLDSLTGHQNQPRGKENQIWSASRLNTWLQCPRMGWLDRRLRVAAPEVLKKDLDARTRGITLHNSIGELICRQLGFDVGEERTDFSIPNIASCELDSEQLMSELLQIVSVKSPWLKRGDAIAVQRRRDFCGLNLKEYNDWWEEGMPPISPKARLGSLLLSEIALRDSIPLVFEAGLGAMDGEPSSPLVIQDPAGSDETLLLRGWIDRVDLVPFPDGTLKDETGNRNPAPLSENDDWSPRRLVVIRDMKTVDGPKSSDNDLKHIQALFDESQLALYCRSWELTHPGDLVVAAGITQIGSHTTHQLEADPRYMSHLSTLSVGEITNHTHLHFRDPNEPHPARSNPFRSWMRWRLMTAFKTARMANVGAVHPTPGKQCRFCNVKQVCGLSHLGGDRR